MAFCGSCGAQVDDATAYCPKCGNRVGAGAAPPAQSSAPGMSENVAGMLCYVLGWMTGIIFLLIDRRPFVRFHAGQSIFVFGVLHILRIIVTRFFVLGTAVGGVAGWGLGWMLVSIVVLATVVLWILLMVKAYKGERYHLPLAGDYAESLAGKVRT